MTFASTLRRVHLTTIFHGVQGKIDLGWRFLVPDGANGSIKVMILPQCRLWRTRARVFFHFELGMRRELRYRVGSRGELCAR